eukprot:3450551-Prymnesium_polylepis.1
MLRKALSLAPARADMYDGLGFAFSRAAHSVDRHVHGEAPMMAPAVERVAGGNDPCWQREKATCFQLEHYGPQHLHIAENDFLKRIERDSSDLRGFALLARLYRNRSVESCVAAVRLNPKQATAYLTLARTLPKGGALGLYDHALGLLPPSHTLQREHGDALRQLRYFARANRAYRRALTLAPTVPSAYHSLAELRLERNRSAEALHIATSALRLHPAAPLPAEARALLASLPEDPNLPPEWKLGDVPAGVGAAGDEGGAGDGGTGAEEEAPAAEGQPRRAEAPSPEPSPELATSLVIMAEARRQQARLREAAELS